MIRSMLRGYKWDCLRSADIGDGASTEKTQRHKLIQVKQPDSSLIIL